MGSQVSKLAQNWHWALRVSLCGEAVWTRRVVTPCVPHTEPASCPQVTPGLGLIAVLLLLFVVQEPKRGAVEARPDHQLHQTSWLKDLQALSKK